MSDPSVRVCIPTLPGVYVIADADGVLFMVPDRAGGWRQRVPYAGELDALVDCSPRVAGAIAQRLGAVRGARNPRGGRPRAPDPPALVVGSSDAAGPSPAGPLTDYLAAERGLDDALAALRQAEAAVELARQRFADAVRFLRAREGGP